MEEPQRCDVEKSTICESKIIILKWVEAADLHVWLDGAVHIDGYGGCLVFVLHGEDRARVVAPCRRLRERGRHAAWIKLTLYFIFIYILLRYTITPTAGIERTVSHLSLLESIKRVLPPVELRILPYYKKAVQCTLAELFERGPDYYRNIVFLVTK